MLTHKFFTALSPATSSAREQQSTGSAWQDCRLMGFAAPLLLIVLMCCVSHGAAVVQNIALSLSVAGLAAGSINSDLSTDHCSATPWLLSAALHYLLFVVYCLSSTFHFISNLIVYL